MRWRLRVIDERSKGSRCAKNASTVEAPKKETAPAMLISGWTCFLAYPAEGPYN